MSAVNLVLLSVVILTCLHTGVAHDSDNVASLSAAVHEILLPIMKEIKNDLNSVKDDLNSVKNDLSGLNKTVSNLSKDLEDYKQKTASELAGLQSNMTSELVGLESNVISAVISAGSHPLDCCQIKVANFFAGTGLYKIRDPSVYDGRIHVRCDMETDGGGWIVIQQRNASLGKVNFTRNWEDYVNGFGDLDGEFWIGLNNIYQLTNQQEVELHISVWNNPGTSITWNYQTFSITNSTDNYRLNVSGGTGDGNRDTLAYNNGHYFSTYDRDNDGSSTNCGYRDQGGWWYRSCTYANLNGRHESSGLPRTSRTEQLLIWNSGSGHVAYTNSIMMIRSKMCGLSG